MRLILFISFIFLSTSIFAYHETWSAEDSIKGFHLFEDSVILLDGTTCHIDNFTDGNCIIEKNWWDFNYLNFWIGLLLPFVFFGYIAIIVKRKFNKRKIN